MGDIKTTRERVLTAKQLDVIKLLFRFRFGTSDLISQALGGLARQSANSRLAILVERGYLTKKRDGNDRVHGKPAIYSLAAKGRAVLRQEPEKYAESVLNSIRANRNSSERFIERNLSIFAIYNALAAKYGEKLVFLTKSNLATNKFDYLPDAKPDAFIQLEVGEGKYFFLYLLDESTPDFALVRRITSVFEYEKSGRWIVKTGFVLPSVLLVCGTNRLQTTITKRVARASRKESSDFVFAATTLDSVLSDEKKAWKSAIGETIALADL